MAAKKDNLPLTLDQDSDSTGTITYANEVVSVIAGVAANEVEGVAGMCAGGGISEVFGRNKNITKGVKVELGTEETSVDIYLVIEYGTPIQTAAQNVQENVRKAIETMTGLHVVRVDVHVQGVSFEKENKDIKAGLDVIGDGSGTGEGGAAQDAPTPEAAPQPASAVRVEFEGDPTPAEEHGEEREPAPAVEESDAAE